MGRGLEVVWPLAAFAPGFVADLVVRGYRPGSAADQLGLMGGVSRWLAERGLAAGDLSVSVAEGFAAERRGAGRTRFVSPRALIPLLSYRRGLGVVPPALVAAPSTPTEALIARYSRYLLERRGLAVSTANPHPLRPVAAASLTATATQITRILHRAAG